MIEPTPRQARRDAAGGQLLLLLIGPCMWLGALVLIYALHAIGCSFGWETVALRAALAAVFLLHLVLIGVLWRRSARAEPAAGETGSFLQWVTLWTLVSAFVTGIVTLGPTLLLTTCL